MTRSEFTSIMRETAAKMFPGCPWMQTWVVAKALHESSLPKDSRDFIAGVVEISILASQYHNPFGIKFTDATAKQGLSPVTLKAPTEDAHQATFTVYPNFERAFRSIEYLIVRSSNYAAPRTRLMEDITHFYSREAWDRFIQDFEAIYCPTPGHLDSIFKWIHRLEAVEAILDRGL
jgi:hypothetical protein